MTSGSKSVRPRYYTSNEVASHNTASDIWVSFLGFVYDLTKLVEENSGSIFHAENRNEICFVCSVRIVLGDVLLKPILDVAGLDISHWFDPRTRDVRWMKRKLRRKAFVVVCFVRWRSVITLTQSPTVFFITRRTVVSFTFRRRFHRVNSPTTSVFHGGKTKNTKLAFCRRKFERFVFSTFSLCKNI